MKEKNTQRLKRMLISYINNLPIIIMTLSTSGVIVIAVQKHAFAPVGRRMLAGLEGRVQYADASFCTKLAQVEAKFVLNEQGLVEKGILQVEGRTVALGT